MHLIQENILRDSLPTMTDSLFTIAILPLDIIWCDREKNLKNVETALRHLRAGTDLVVLPELFSTGFVHDPDMLGNVGESVSGPTMKAIGQLAHQHNVAIAGSFLSVSDGKYYNRGFFTEPSGDTFFYDKHHLFSPSSEGKLLTSGHSRAPIMRYRGWNITMIVCYDLRFPVWCRNVKNIYDIMLVPANWPNQREYAWKHLLIARAIENQAIMVGANRSGSDDYGTYQDMSAIYDAVGQPIHSVDEKSGIIYATVSRTHLAELRRKFPVSNDAEDFYVL